MKVSRWIFGLYLRGQFEVSPRFLRFAGLFKGQAFEDPPA
jgi:hypothetical protein